MSSRLNGTLVISYYLVFSSYCLVGCELLGRSQLISNK